MPTSCSGVPADILNPRNLWQETSEYDKTAKHLANLFKKNFAKYEADASKAILKAGPK
jgi:phosphoenolpyruvate carboxykinase (ATP)